MTQAPALPGPAFGEPAWVVSVRAANITAGFRSSLCGLCRSCQALDTFANAPGSGLHFYFSITNEASRTVFADRADLLLLSQDGYRFVAGLLHHADGLSALCAPTVNSCKRLASSESASGTTWSPVWKSYGDHNRTCVVRTVGGRLEWRLPDPSCNVYAAIAVTLASLFGSSSISGMIFHNLKYRHVASPHNFS